jgi:hypothetical protein
MHPVIRIVCVLSNSLFLSQGGYYHIALSFILLFPFYFTFPHCFIYGWYLLRRLRWFFLSLIVLYTVMIPIELWLEEGFYVGMERILCLVAIVLNVNILIQLTQRNEILGALYWFIAPLQKIGIKTEKMLLRVLLTLDYTYWIKTELTQQKASLLVQLKEKENSQKLVLIFDKIVCFLQIILKNTPQKNQSFEFDILVQPLRREWSYPLFLWVLHIAIPT